MISKMAVLSLLVPMICGNALAIEIVNRPYSTQSNGVGQAQHVQVQPVKPSGPIQKSWTLDIKDVNYYGAFQRWATEAGYQVRWDADKHFLVEAVDTFSGSFEDALTGVLKNPAVVFSKYPLEVCFYPNTPPLARISRKGVQEKECQ